MRMFHHFFAVNAIGQYQHQILKFVAVKLCLHKVTVIPNVTSYFLNQ